MCGFTEGQLCALREELVGVLSPLRLAHTLGVEQTAARMAAYYCPACEGTLRAAALLHDVTKEYDAAQTAAVLAREGISLRADERATPAIHHAITAPAEIVRLYPLFATRDVLDAVRWHSTAREDLTLVQAILYLADVIEPGRTYPACVALRDRFFGADLSGMAREQRLWHLADAVLLSLEGIRDDLLAKGGCVVQETLAAIADLTMKKTKGLVPFDERKS